MIGRCSVALVVGLAASSAALRAAPVEGIASLAQSDLVVSRANVSESVVALTFDDGPRDPYTAQILDVLRDHGVVATFFLIGENVVRHPMLANRIVREGHAVGNHSFSHRSLPTLADQQIRAEIERAAEAIRMATGLRPWLLRPPYGAMDSRLRGSHGIPASGGNTVILWSVQASDWSTRSAQRVALRTLTQVRPGSIILLHDGGGSRGHVVTATRWMVANLSRRGFRMVTVPDLLAMQR